MQCSNCGNDKLMPAGVLIRGKDLVRYKQFSCTTCGHREEFVDGVSNVGSMLQAHEQKFVVTSALNNKNIDGKFLSVLERYCKLNKAKLVVIPVRYINDMQGDDVWYPEEIQQYLLEDNLSIHGAACKILGGLRISATAENPLSGIDPMSKGDSLIIGHPQVQMKTLPVVQGRQAPILWTTGTVSENAYSDTKLGYKATFNHSQSALLVDFNGNTLHVRNLNYDGTGFNDLEYRYDAKRREKERVHSLITGDEHALFAEESVKSATYLAKDSMVAILRPLYIVRHDLLDCNTISHHDKSNFLGRFRKFVKGSNSLTKELEITKKHMEETSPKGCINVVVSSNHIDHMTRWLNECDPKNDPENAILYHGLMYELLSRMKNGETSIDPFELWMSKNCSLDILYTNRESLKFFDIEIGLHGDKGSNGSKGSRASFAKLPEKCVIGHSHSPGWEKGCVQVGTSSRLDLDYARSSPSSWRHAHCIIHNNGKRQIVFITNGEWK